MPESPEVSPEAGLEEKDADLREDKQEEDVMSKRERLARTGLISLSFMLSLVRLQSLSHTVDLRYM